MEAVAPINNAVVDFQTVQETVDDEDEEDN